MNLLHIHLSFYKSISFPTNVLIQPNLDGEVGWDLMKELFRHESLRLPKMCTQYNHSNLGQIKVFTDTFDTKKNKANCHFCSILVYMISLYRTHRKSFTSKSQMHIAIYQSWKNYQWRFTMSVFFCIHSKMNFPYSIPQREIVREEAALMSNLLISWALQ